MKKYEEKNMKKYKGIMKDIYEEYERNMKKCEGTTLPYIWAVGLRNEEI